MIQSEFYLIIIVYLRNSDFCSILRFSTTTVLNNILSAIGMSMPVNSTTQKPDNQTTKTVKFSNLFKNPEIVRCLVKFHPLMWLKLKMTSRLFAWRLEDSAFADMLPYINEELRLTDPNLSVHDLAYKGDIDSLWLLLLQGLSTRQRCPFNNATLLQKAIHSGNVQLIQMLLIKGANPNVKGAYGYTALHECSYVGTAQICQTLLHFKANVDAISKNGSTPLLVAAREGHQDICEVLLAHGAHPDDGGDKGWTPLFIAAGEGHLNVVQTLLQYGANVHETSLQEGKTAAEEAYHNKHESIGMLLEMHMQQHMQQQGQQENQFLMLQQQLEQLQHEREQIKTQLKSQPNMPIQNDEVTMRLQRRLQENEMAQQQLHVLMIHQMQMGKQIQQAFTDGSSNTARGWDVVPGANNVGIEASESSHEDSSTWKQQSENVESSDMAVSNESEIR